MLFPLQGSVSAHGGRGGKQAAKCRDLGLHCLSKDLHAYLFALVQSICPQMSRSRPATCRNPHQLPVLCCRCLTGCHCSFPSRVVLLVGAGQSAIAVDYLERSWNKSNRKVFLWYLNQKSLNKLVNVVKNYHWLPPSHQRDVSEPRQPRPTTEQCRMRGSQGECLT